MAAAVNSQVGDNALTLATSSSVFQVQPPLVLGCKLRQQVVDKDFGICALRCAMTPPKLLCCGFHGGAMYKNVSDLESHSTAAEFVHWCHAASCEALFRPRGPEGQDCGRLHSLTGHCVCCIHRGCQQQRPRARLFHSPGFCHLLCKCATFNSNQLLCRTSHAL